MGIAARLSDPQVLRCFGAVILGILTTLAFAPYDQIWLLPITLTGLIFLWSGSTARQAFWLGAGFGVGHFGSGLYWIVISTYVYGGAPIWVSGILVTLLVSYTSLYPAAVGYVSRRWSLSPVLWALLQLPALWLFFELLRGWLLTGFPWLSLGYAAIDTELVRVAPVAGVHALSAVLVFVAGALWLLIKGTSPARMIAVGLLAGLSAAVALMPKAGGWTYPVGEPVSVALVQGNIPQEDKWLPEKLNPTIKRYLALSEEVPEDTRLIIWPEAAVPALYHHLEDSFYAYLQEWALARNTTVLTGSLRERDGRIINTQFPVGLDSGSEYIKRHLVPFGEYFPVPDFMRWFMQGIHLDYEDIKPGPIEQSLIEVAGLRLGVSICFEDVFGRDIRRDLPDAQVLVNVTNDGWFADASAPHQHLQIARMRSIEAGRPMLRVSNRGVSGHIRSDGVVQAQTGFFSAEWVFTTVSAHEGLTPYVRWGDMPLWVLSGLLVLISIVMVQRRQSS